MLALLAAVAMAGGPISVNGAGFSPSSISTDFGGRIWDPHYNDGATFLDLFDDSALTGWSDWDVPTLGTNTEDASGLTVSVAVPPSGSYDLAGIYRAAPADASGDYMITAKLDWNGLYDGYDKFHTLFIADDISGSPSTARVAIIAAVWGSPGGYLATKVQTWSQYDTPWTAHTTLLYSAQPTLWARWCIDDSADTASALISHDGRVWTEITPAGTILLTGQAQYYGIAAAAAYNASATDPAVVHSDLIRVDPVDSSCTEPHGGWL